MQILMLDGELPEGQIAVTVFPQDTDEPKELHIIVPVGLKLEGGMDINAVVVRFATPAAVTQFIGETAARANFIWGDRTYSGPTLCDHTIIRVDGTCVKCNARVLQ